MRWKDITSVDLFENGGRIVPGVNTTVDVGVGEIQRQGAKYGFVMDKDGQVPLIYDIMNNKSLPPPYKPPKLVPKREHVKGDYPENRPKLKEK
jgi:hypothetical protein